MTVIIECEPGFDIDHTSIYGRVDGEIEFHQLVGFQDYIIKNNSFHITNRKIVEVTLFTAGKRLAFLPLKKRVIFLDIDGVLQHSTLIVANNWRVAYAGDYSSSSFCVVGRQFVKNLAERADASVVLCSTWGETMTDLEVGDLGKMLGITFSGVVRSPMPFQQSRGDMIANYLKEHSVIEDYLLIDDEHLHYSDEQKKHLIHVNEGFGVSILNITDAYSYFKVENTPVQNNIER